VGLVNTYIYIGSTLYLSSSWAPVTCIPNSQDDSSSQMFTVVTTLTIKFVNPSYILDYWWGVISLASLGRKGLEHQTNEVYSLHNSENDHLVG